MKAIILSISIILLASTSSPNNNTLIGKWELIYVKAANDGWSSNGKDTTYENGFSEQTMKHGKSVVIEFKEDGSYNSRDFRIDSLGTISKGKYILITNDKILLNKDTMRYSIDKDTLKLENLKRDFLMEYLRQQ